MPDKGAGGYSAAGRTTMKKAALFSFSLLAFLLSLTGCNSYSYNIFGNISGIVTEAESGAPLPSAVVTLVPGSSTVQTGTDGKFSFTGLDEGQYTVSVQKTGYQPNRKTVSVLSDETTEIVVTLSAIPQ